MTFLKVVRCEKHRSYHICFPVFQGITVSGGGNWGSEKGELIHINKNGRIMNLK